MSNVDTDLYLRVDSRSRLLLNDKQRLALAEIRDEGTVTVPMNNLGHRRCLSALVKRGLVKKLGESAKEDGQKNPNQFWGLTDVGREVSFLLPGAKK